MSSHILVRSIDSCLITFPVDSIALMYGEGEYLAGYIGGNDPVDIPKGEYLRLSEIILSPHEYEELVELLNDEQE